MSSREIRCDKEGRGHIFDIDVESIHTNTQTIQKRKCLKVSESQRSQ